MRLIRPVLAAALTAYTVVLAAFLLSSGEVGGESGVEWLYLIPVSSATAMGMFLAVRRPDNSIGTLSSLTGASLMTLGAVNHLTPVAAESGNQLATLVLILASDTAWMVQLICALVLLPLWFPSGSSINHRWAWVGRIAIACAVLAWISFAFGDTVCVAYEAPQSEVCVETMPIPWSVDAIPDLEALLGGILAMAVPAVASVFIRLHRSRGVERQQLKWFLLAVSFFAAGTALSFFGDLPQAATDIINALTLGGLWVAIAVAIVRYRLYDIDRIISRTLSYAVVIGLLAAVVFGLVALSTTVLPSTDPLVVAMATLAVAALFNPVRRRVQQIVDRRFNRTRYNAERVLDEFAGSLRDRADAEGIVDGWIDVVHQVVQPSVASVWLKR